MIVAENKLDHASRWYLVDVIVNQIYVCKVVRVRKVRVETSEVMRRICSGEVVVTEMYWILYAGTIP